MLAPYPNNTAERTAWIATQRGPRYSVDARRPNGFFVEDEVTDGGKIVSVATIFLTNRECPWRCVMCDLWQRTLIESVPEGAIPEQINFSLAQLPPTSVVKLYNSGSFFDGAAIPAVDHGRIAAQLTDFERVIVESHPAFVGSAARRFEEQLQGMLEVAMGLETVHPQILPKLNKQMTLRQFARAADFLHAHGMALRAFILVKPPFLEESEAVEWAVRSLRFAFDCGATAATLIPTRGGNGALETLAARGQFAPPKLVTLEAATEEGLALKRGRVFADLWDLERFSGCVHCFAGRKARLRKMNLQQVILPGIVCPHCEAS